VESALPRQSGEQYDCHPHVVNADGTGRKKLASRNGYRARARDGRDDPPEPP
jgi:hypothetical protein